MFKILHQEMTQGAVPVFLNLKVWSTVPPCTTEPKSYFTSSNVMAGPAAAAVGAGPARPQGSSGRNESRSDRFDGVRAAGTS